MGAKGRARTSVKADTPDVAAGMSVASAFQAIARSCLRHFRANETVFRANENPDAVHQMRVALRRLRAAMSLFKRILADDESARLKEELRGLAATLGEARDLDVYLEKTLVPACDDTPDDRSLAELKVATERRRAAAYSRLRRALRAKPVRAFIAEVDAWIEGGEWLRNDAAKAAGRREAPIERFATRELARRAKRIRVRGRDLDRLSPDARHEVRIAVKKLRYAAEFFAPLYDGKGRAKRSKAFRSALSDLQDHLGELNDIAVAESIAGGAEGRPITPVLHPEHRAERIAKHLTAAGKAYANFAAAEPFWA